MKRWLYSSVENSCTEFHDNSSDGLAADTRSRTEVRGPHNVFCNVVEKAEKRCLINT